MDVEELRLLESIGEAFRDAASVGVFCEILQDAPLESVSVSNRILELLRWAIRCNHMNVDVLKVFMDFMPGLLERQDTLRGGFLLHGACGATPSREMIEFLIEHNPSALCEADFQGWLPLHIACKRQASLEVVQMLLSHDPNAVRSRELKTGKLPLHLCLKFNAPKEVTVAVLEEYPDAATNAHPTRGGALALHLYCEQGAVIEMDILRRLVQVYPEGLQEESPSPHGMRLPILHAACCNPNAALEAVKFLANECPGSVEVKTPMDEMLPLHLASKFAPMDVLEFLVEAYPDAVSTLDAAGMLPMHCACTSEPPRGNHLQVLIDNYNGPDESFGLAVVDSYGRVPLHYATRQGDAETVQWLVDRYPEGVHVMERHGGLPLHAACIASTNLSLEKIQCLVGADPRTVIQKDFLDRTPYLLVRQRRRRFHEIEMFLVDQQDIVVNELKQAVEEVAETQLQFPDLVAARIWSFAKPDLWQPE